MARLTIGGVGAAPGIGMGRAYLYGGPGTTAGPAPAGRGVEVVPVAARPVQLQRLREARAAARAQLERVGTEVGERAGADEGAIFAAQALFLDDPALLAPIESAIGDDGHPAAAAVARVLESAARDLEALDDPSLTARAADVRDVKQRLLRLLGDAPDAPDAPGPPGFDEARIIVARDLTPSDTAGLDGWWVRGIVLADGTPAAHAAILARGLGFPLVVGGGTAIWQIEQGQEVLVDGTSGAVLVEPDARESARYRRRARSHGKEGAARGEAAHLPVVTQDGRPVAVVANASSVAEARLARDNGAEGIGLLRTEFLLAALQGGRGAPPDEDALAAAYGAIFALMGPRPVVVRAMDAGGDKPLPFLDMGHEANPALGWRGIRVLLAQPALFAAQIRALRRAAAAHGTDARLMLPMVSGVDEVARARALIEGVYQAEDSTAYPPLQVGVMIEVPGAALIADALAREAAFFSLGTNDLVQYTLACDRGNARVSHIGQVAHPAVLRLVDLVVRAAHAAGRTVSVCGEAAGDAAAVPLLIGLGADELSVAPARLPAVRAQLRRLEYRRLQVLAAAALDQATAGDVARLMEPSTGSTA